MKPHNLCRRDANVVRRFVEERRAWRQTWHRDPPQLKLSWSNWSFGSEPLEVSAARLAGNGIHYIELHGDLMPRAHHYRAEARAILGDWGIQAAGVCGANASDQAFASDQPRLRQRAVDAVRRQADLCAELGGSYVLFGVGPLGLPVAGDDDALRRCAASIRQVAEYLDGLGIRGAIGPARPRGSGNCCPLVATERLLRLIDHPGVAHLNGTLCDLLAVEGRLGALLLEHGHLFANLHLADPDRQGLDRSLLSFGLVLMALYAVGYHLDCAAGWCTPEPLCGGGPYHPSAARAPADPAALDALVATTARRFYESEAAVLAAGDDELLGLVEEQPA